MLAWSDLSAEKEELCCGYSKCGGEVTLSHPSFISCNWLESSEYGCELATEKMFSFGGGSSVCVYVECLPLVSVLGNVF